ncbi:acetoacetate decarboxylase family protein [Cellulomonas sp. URHD0024]|uniref:acetoacetate decarboxylase family protein n=1 Tax=Cellulomonas sp. URHD0024 TaxID=1302620 RepID=UPI00041B3347|nr:acetoacetate decarboxylase family protein [Cellulomonas sp. URHD0024]
MNAVIGTARAVLSRLPSPVPRRQRRLTGQSARVDTIPYDMPVSSEDSPVLMAAFPCSLSAARALLPGRELHPVSLGFGKGIAMVTVVNYRATDIGKYIEYSMAIAVTHGPRPAPPLVPMALQRTLQFGQYVVDLPVSTEVSVKGGKGIWGMPKHAGSLDFVVTDETVSAQYDDLDGRFGALIEIERPGPTALPLKLAAANFCAFRGMLMKSTIYFEATGDVAVGPGARGRFVLGDAPSVAPLRTLQIGPHPLFTAYLPTAHGVLDDHFEAWFLTDESLDKVDAQTAAGVFGESLESVVGLGRGETWPAAPKRGRVESESDAVHASRP